MAALVGMRLWFAPSLARPPATRGENLLTRVRDYPDPHARALLSGTRGDHSAAARARRDIDAPVRHTRRDLQPLPLADRARTPRPLPAGPRRHRQGPQHL